MPTKYSITQTDYAKEKTASTFNVAATATLATLEPLKAAVDGMAVGRLHQEELSASVRLSNLPATSEAAQRENKISISYQDNSNLQLGTYEIGCIDPATLTFIGNSDDVDMVATAAAATLKTAMETHVKSSDGGAITVLGMKYVGRAI